MSGKSRPPLPLTPDQNQNVVEKNGDNTGEYTPNKFYNDDGLSRISERRDQPQRRRSENRPPQYQQYTQYAQNNPLPQVSIHDPNQNSPLNSPINSPINSVEQNDQVTNNNAEMKMSPNGADQKPPMNYRPRPPDSYPSGSRPGPVTNPSGAQTRRQKSLVKPERAHHDSQKPLGRPSGDKRLSPLVAKKKKCQCPSAWVMFSRCITCWSPPFLSCCGMNDVLAQHAWREKVALVVIIISLCIAVGFLTFGFDQVFCGAPPTRIRTGAISNTSVSILGRVFNIKGFPHPTFPGINSSNFEKTAGGNDLSFLFQGVNFHCKGLFVPIIPADTSGNAYNYFPCQPLSNNDPMTPNNTLNPERSGCHGSTYARKAISTLKYVGDIFYDWDDVQSPNHNYVVYNGQVFDMDRLQWTVSNIQLPAVIKPLMYASTNPFRGRDITYFLQKNYSNVQLGKCMEETLRVGVVDTISIGCVISSAVMFVSLLFIAGVVLVRFFLAVLFGWILSWRLGSFREETAEEIAKREREIELWSNENNHFYPSTNNSRNNSTSSFGIFTKSRFSTPNVNSNALSYRRDSRPSSRNAFHNTGNGAIKEFNSSRNSRPSSINEFNQSRADSMTSTSSAAQSTPYPNNNALTEQRYNFPLMHTILLVTCYSEADGTIFGAGNDLSTPDICVSLMNDHLIHPNDVEPHSYVAIADGKKRHNKAKVYAGFYHYRELDGRQDRVPMITIAKCGGPGEESEAKAGNRGKRDSQIILMSFLQKVMFNERMTRLEYELFTAIRSVCHITPDFFEIVLMIDADTKVFPDSLVRMVASFESIFGGVTCLPGCFCMYRIKAPKGENGYWVPILANPDIVEQYSENVVDTLHKKNLLLLGEDRYLTTLMLKNFPKRKTLFVPQSVCKTVVPDTFRVLRSQRRRWINSTVHNLLELVLIPDLCGTFCFSMQFVIFMELVGTVVLPAAISFTMYLIIISFFQTPPPIVPLLLLAAVLGLPAILIMVTTRKVIYVGWMFIYLLSLPIWNFVLPSYAFWHFDDFSWGQTRVVRGEDGRADHSRREGEFDSSHIVMRRWAEWELYKLRHNSHQRIQSVQLSPDENFNIPSTRPSSASTMYGSEKSESIPIAPLSARSGGMRRKTDSLMVPPPLSDSSPVSTVLNEGLVSTPGDYSQMSQPTYPSPSRSNTNSTNYSHSSNLHAGIIGGVSYSNGYEENNHST
ncbi:16860_t:CDS:10 [Cetraspora pellucida]|uniref:chitin synthase n=1 Tax=Cetraspora pellucida TaxID=1433469 RepID=A0A9N9APJ7_9GLOM|nr:16860_t:CDS:10 [Cetraspora pellucida]